MPGADREYQITYGNVIVGGISSEYLLDGFTSHVITDGTSESSIEFTVIVVSGSEAGLAAACNKLETTFRTPRLGLHVSLKGASILHVSHATASGGFNTNPEIEKPGETGDTARSRVYRCRVRFETPADHSGGLRELSVNVEQDEARIRTVTISGAYTATSSAGARSRYDAGVDSLASTQLSSVGVTTSELIGQPSAESDYDDKVLRFSRTYRELIFGQGQNSPNDSNSIVEQTLNVARREVGEDRANVDGNDAQAFATFDIRYEAWVNAENSTDLASEYDGVRDWLLNQIADLFNQGEYALVSERPTYSRARNRFSVDIVAEGSVDGETMIRRTVTIQDRITEPETFIGAFDGNPLTHYRYQGFVNAVRVIVDSYRTTDGVSSTQALNRVDQLSGRFQNSPSGYSGGNWRVVQRDASVSPLKKGIRGSGNELSFTDVLATLTMRYTRDVARTGGGGRTSARPTPTSGSGSRPAARVVINQGPIAGG